MTAMLWAVKQRLEGWSASQFQTTGGLASRTTRPFECGFYSVPTPTQPSADDGALSDRSSLRLSCITAFIPYHSPPTTVGIAFLFCFVLSLLGLQAWQVGTAAAARGEGKRGAGGAGQETVKQHTKQASIFKSPGHQKKTKQARTKQKNGTPVNSER
jgi:hypothetical protein